MTGRFLEPAGLEFLRKSIGEKKQETKKISFIKFIRFRNNCQLNENSLHLKSAFGIIQCMESRTQFIFILCIITVMAVAGGYRATGAESAGNGKTIAVIGFANETGNAEWDNQLIGYGLSQLLLQKLYDTGKYVPVEENPEIIGEIDRLINNQWKAEAAFYQETDAEKIARNIKADTVAYGKVIRFDVSRSKSFLGPFSSSKSKVRVEVEIYLKDRNSPVRISTGAGSASTKSRGVFFQIRDDQIYFDQTAVGRAAEKAVIEAVEELFK